MDSYYRPEILLYLLFLQRHCGHKSGIEMLFYRHFGLQTLCMNKTRTFLLANVNDKGD